MNKEKKQLAFAILEFLNTSIQDNSIDQENVESVQIGIQCIGEAFGIDVNSSVDISKYSIKPASLSSIFKVFLSAQQRKGASVGGSSSVGSSGGSGSADTNDTNDNNDTITVDIEKKAEVLKIEGNAKLVEKKYSEAIQKYSQAIHLNPTNPIYYCNRAAAYSQSGQHEEAVKDAELAISIDPNYIKAYSRCGAANYSLGRFDQAVECYERGLAIDPSNQSLLSSLQSAQSKLMTTTTSTTTATSATSTTSDNANAAGGEGGMDFASILSNPALMGMAQQFMKNPQMAGMLGNLMGGNSNNNGGTPDISSLLSNPDIMRMAQQFAQDPKASELLKNIQK